MKTGKYVTVKQDDVLKSKKASTGYGLNILITLNILSIPVCSTYFTKDVEAFFLCKNHPY